VLLACGRGSPEERLEALFPICDVDGDSLVQRGELAAALRMVYFARFRDPEVVDIKVDKLVEEAMAGAEDDALSLRQFTEWARSDQSRVDDLRELLRTPIVSMPDDGKQEAWALRAQMAFEKIKVDNPIVELDGDEMARIMWQMIKEKLIFPFLDMDIDYYDLSVTYRDETDDQVTREAAAAIQKCKVGIKCATITPDAARVLEFNLQQMWPSPSGTLRRILGGTSFSVPIAVQGIPRCIQNWRKPIVIGRHSPPAELGASELVAEGPGTFELVFRPEDGSDPVEVAAHTAKSSGGVLVGTCLTRETLEPFAHSCFEFALGEGLPLYLSARGSGAHDSLFIDVFHHVYQATYKRAFDERGLWYQHRPVEELVVHALRSSGGFVWAAKSSDGDVLTSLVAQGYGSPGLMTSVLLSPDGDGGTLVAEAAHGTVTRHYRAHQRGEKTSVNPLACIFAWTRGLGHRARLDGNERLALFSRALEEACLTCVENGQMSRDLAAAASRAGAAPADDSWLATEELLSALANELRLELSRPPRPPRPVQDTPFA